MNHNLKLNYELVKMSVAILDILFVVHNAILSTSSSFVRMDVTKRANKWRHFELHSRSDKTIVKKLREENTSLVKYY